MLALVVTESVDEVVAGLGAKLPPPAAPSGSPLALNVTVLVKPFERSYRDAVSWTTRRSVLSAAKISKKYKKPRDAR